jgi:hypothetical protein
MGACMVMHFDQQALIFSLRFFAFLPSGELR